MMPSLPHSMTSGTGDCRTILTEVLRLCGQPRMGPSGVRDQSKFLINAPNSPPPTGNTSASSLANIRPPSAYALCNTKVHNAGYPLAVPCGAPVHLGCDPCPLIDVLHLRRAGAGHLLRQRRLQKGVDVA